MSALEYNNRQLLKSENIQHPKDIRPPDHSTAHPPQIPITTSSSTFRIQQPLASHNSKQTNKSHSRNALHDISHTSIEDVSKTAASPTPQSQIIPTKFSATKALPMGTPTNKLRLMRNGSNSQISQSPSLSSPLQSQFGPDLKSVQSLSNNTGTGKQIQLQQQGGFKLDLKPFSVGNRSGSLGALPQNGVSQLQLQLPQSPPTRSLSSSTSQQ